MSIAEKARQAGMKPNLVYSRLRAGWTEAEALSKPLQKKAVSEMIGKVYGSLLILKETGKRNKANISIILVRCLCGDSTCRGEFEILSSCVRNGNTKSCGSLGRKFFKAKHNDAGTRLYKCWKSMKIRSNNTPSVQRHRGNIYEECTRDSNWDQDYLSFKEWSLTNGYDDTKVLHRINNIPHYGPQTCKWVTKLEHHTIHTELRKNNKEIIGGINKC